MKRIYLDYASLTPIDPRVIREMKKYSSVDFANPSSLYKEGVAAKKALEEGRIQVAEFLHAHADEIVFTSGGTEANGLALEGAGRMAHRNGFEKSHLIISAIEHSSVMETAAMMEKHGVEVTRLSVDSNGVVSLEELKKALKPNTFMVSIMTVNNEIGSVQPLKDIAKIVRDYRKSKNDSKNRYPLLHTDAAQAVLYEDLNMEKLGVDLLTLDGSKSYGPRGIGCLYVRRGTPIGQIIYGGGQERGLRSGTENIPAVKGFAMSLEIAADNRRPVGRADGGQKETVRVAELRAQFIEGLKSVRPDISVNPSFVQSDENFRHFEKDAFKGAAVPPAQSQSAPHILNVTIPGIDNEFFVLQLDARGIACSTKSSCLRDEDESYVLKAIGADSKTSVRFSFGRWTKKGDVATALKAIKEILAKNNQK